MGKKRNAYKILVGILHEKIVLGRTRLKLEDNIKMSLK
jgi:hypothetical protein